MMSKPVCGWSFYIFFLKSYADEQFLLSFTVSDTVALTEIAAAIDDRSAFEPPHRSCVSFIP